jgi:hypothetical protein
MFDLVADVMMVLSGETVLVVFLPDPFEFPLGLSDIGNIVFPVTGFDACVHELFVELMDINDHGPPVSFTQWGGFYGGFQFARSEPLKGGFASQPEQPGKPQNFQKGSSV